MPEEVLKLKIGADVAAFNRGVRKVGTGVNKLKASVLSLKTAVLGAATAFAAWKLSKYAKNTALLAARYETLGIVMNQVGRIAGHNTREMAKFQSGLESTGISMIQSRQNLTRMAQAQLDLNKSTDLARIAQDAAVIGNINSSEAFERLILGIQRARVVILKTIGIQVNFQDAYKKMAKTLGTTTNKLTEQQKVQARLNSVLEFGTRIFGVYEAAMTTAGKKMLSLIRFFENFAVKVGAIFGPALVLIIDGVTVSIKGLIEMVDRLEKEGKIAAWAIRIVEALDGVIEKTKETATAINSFLKPPQTETQIFFAWLTNFGVQIWEAFKLVGKGVIEGFVVILKAGKDFVVTLGHQFYLLGRVMWNALTFDWAEMEISWQQLIGTANNLEKKLQQNWKTYGDNLVANWKLAMARIRALTEDQTPIEIPIKLSEITEKRKPIELPLKKTEKEKAKPLTPEELVKQQENIITQIEALSKQHTEFITTTGLEGVELTRAQGLLEIENTREKYDTLIEMARQAGMQVADIEEEKNARLAAMTKEHTKTIAEAEREQMITRLGYASQIAGNMAATFQKLGEAGAINQKKAFKMQKAFAIVSATIDAIKGVNATLGDSTINPSYLRVALAASIGAMGMAQVAAIAAQRPPAYGEGGISRSPEFALVGEKGPEAHVPLKGGSIPVSISGGQKQINYIDLRESTFMNEEVMAATMRQVASITIAQETVKVIRNDYEMDGDSRNIIRSAN